MYPLLWKALLQGIIDYPRHLYRLRDTIFTAKTFPLLESMAWVDLLCWN